MISRKYVILIKWPSFLAPKVLKKSFYVVVRVGKSRSWFSFQRQSRNYFSNKYIIFESIRDPKAQTILSQWFSNMPFSFFFNFVLSELLLCCVAVVTRDTTDFLSFPHLNQNCYHPTRVVYTVFSFGFSRHILFVFFRFTSLMPAACEK